ncbi:MAG: hypothetical protein AAFQ41_16915 [Cyanobacteria bacterium J06623_7]
MPHQSIIKLSLLATVFTGIGLLTMTSAVKADGDSSHRHSSSSSTTIRRTGNSTSVHRRGSSSSSSSSSSRSSNTRVNISLPQKAPASREENQVRQQRETNQTEGSDAFDPEEYIRRQLGF